MAQALDLQNPRFWDDSALIDSWDEAVAEYKKYHSIQATGKRLEDVLTEEELKQLREDYGDVIEQVDTKSGGADPNEDAEQGQAEAMSNGEITMEELAKVEVVKPSDHQQPAKATEVQQPRHNAAPAKDMPQVLLGSVQDENLKNLMMSWYYAGYYTGLHAGQQQGGGSDST